MTALPASAETITTLDLPESFAELQRRIEALEAEVARGSQNGLPENLTRNSIEAAPGTGQDDRLTLLVFSGELDRLLAAFVLATGAAACGTKVSMFFTFWATAALKKGGRQARGKSIVERMFGWMLPGGLNRRKLSHLDMMGAGRWMMCREMANKNIASLPEMIAVADELGVEISLCDMSMSLMGIRHEELIDYSNINTCGVAHFLDLAASSKTTLFI